jgi:TfoX/Sxy family transcriptional regulator of competence genes
MAYDEKQAERVRRLLKHTKGITEKRMFGGLAFMFNGHMCCGVLHDQLVVRVGSNAYDQALKRKHVIPMDFTGKPLTGFVYVRPAGIKRSDQLKSWLDAGLRFVRTLPKK